MDAICIKVYNGLLRMLLKFFALCSQKFARMMVLYERMHRTHRHGIIFVHLGFS